MTAIASLAQLRMSLLRAVLITVPFVLLLGTISMTVADASGYNPWFRGLTHPEFAPAGWVIGSVFMLAWLLLGLVLAMLLHARGARWRRTAITLFLIQLVLAFAWPPVMFAFHELGAALLVVAAMIAIDLVLLVFLLRIRPLAALLLLLFLGWLFYLAALTWRLVELNPVVPQPASTDIAL